MYANRARALAALAACLIGVPCAAAVPPAHSISGQVTATGGGPLADARVAIVELRRVATTGADGRYAFAAVAPGTYRISFARTASGSRPSSGATSTDPTSKPRTPSVSR